MSTTQPKPERCAHLSIGINTLGSYQYVCKLCKKGFTTAEYVKLQLGAKP